MKPPRRVRAAALAAAGLLCSLLGAREGHAQPLDDWPPVRSAIARDAALEARAAAIVSSMTLPQKIGQMTQAEIRAVTPDEVRRYYLGSVLNGGGSVPGQDKHAEAARWLELAQAYHAASMATDLRVPVPLIWGTDAVHGHGNAFGATLFPHNIALGAANDAALTAEIGAATAKAVRATGIQWVFAPTLAVARDDRWGRTYESFSEDPNLVGALGAAYVRGLQRGLGGTIGVVATAKHFMGDGGTDEGRDQGITLATRAQMISMHATGYVGALGAGAQTVMASFNSWNDLAAGVDHGKMHGSHEMLTEVLKERMGFDGFVVSDWNGIGQVPGCTPASCAQAINAGIDMVMVPQDWKAFIANTMAQVQGGQIPMARIDDAVTRIVRVKLRAGLFDQAPAQGAGAGDMRALQARDLARRAVRESLVLLKNNGRVLPLASKGGRILVVGKNANSLANQSGGWSLTWQGTGNTNADFPVGDTVLAGIRAALGEAHVVFSERAADVEVGGFDAVIAVIGETPYAEGSGDIPPSGTLHHASRYPEDLAVLKRVSGKGRPVVTVLLSGRPLHVNDLLNLSDAFVAAWLPGTEGAGVADLLFRARDGSAPYDFRGRLSFSWPRAACQTPLNVGDAKDAPLFPFGYGLAHASDVTMTALDASLPSGGCSAQTELPIFKQSARPPYSLHVGSETGAWADAEVGDDPNTTFEAPAGHPQIRVSTVQINTQQDARQVEWSGGAARFFAWSAQQAVLSAYPDAALLFDVVVSRAPQGVVTMTMECGPGCASGSVDATRLFAQAPPGLRRSIKIPLACFAARGADLGRVSTPFSVATAAPFAAAFAHIRLVAGAAKDGDAIPCQELAAAAARTAR